jgi:hypothetical protein
VEEEEEEDEEGAAVVVVVVVVVEFVFAAETSLGTYPSGAKKEVAHSTVRHRMIFSEQDRVLFL